MERHEKSAASIFEAAPFTLKLKTAVQQLALLLAGIAGHRII